MKRIHELGFMNHVFPSANHTRFEHLLGTMYVTGLAIDFLKMNEGIRLKKEKKRSIHSRLCYMI